MKRSIAATLAAGALVVGVVAGLAMAADGNGTSTTSEPGPGTVTVTVSASPRPASVAPSPRPSGQASTTAPADDPQPADHTIHPAGGWPGPDNTGVPEGTPLTGYSGPCTITTNGTVIDSKTVNCPDLLIRAADVTVRNSLVNGHVLVDTDTDQAWSLTLSDSEVDASSGGDLPAISNGNVTIVRTDIHGGHNGLECQEHSSHCVIRDSWIHDQWQAPSGDTHLGGLLVLGNQVPCTGRDGACAEIIHNTVVCDAEVNADGGGCTGDINLLPHFGPLPGAIIERNLLGANVDGSAYCTYAGAGVENPATKIVYRDNVFMRGANGKCAAYGPVTGFDSSAPGNVWTNNRYDDGTPVHPAL